MLKLYINVAQSNICHRLTAYIKLCTSLQIDDAVFRRQKFLLNNVQIMDLDIYRNGDGGKHITHMLPECFVRVDLDESSGETNKAQDKNTNSANMESSPSERSVQPALPPWLTHPSTVAEPVTYSELHDSALCPERLAKEENIRESDGYMKYVVPSQQDLQQQQPAPPQPHQQHQGQQTKGLIVRDASTNTDDLWQHTVDSESDNCTKCVPEICGKGFPSASALMNHDRYHRGQRPYQCDTCCKAFATSSHLVTHRRTHTGERPFQCQVCNRTFADRSAFVKHERTHGPDGTVVKRYKCEVCGNYFTDSCGLKKHIRIHTGERPYQCNVCEKSFSTSSTFVAHRRIHTGERPYKCEVCTKMFITKSHLLTHRRVHSGEKPFTCQVCSRSFADGSSFRRHERLHTGENRFNCHICGRGFPVDTSLQKHLQTHLY